MSTLTTATVALRLDIITDEYNVPHQREVKDIGTEAVHWPAVPRVGDLISLPSGNTLTVKAVFWDWPTCRVTVRAR